MTSFFKRLLNPGGRPPTESRAARLTLAIFGKHPGWNDHIPGINVETEALAHVKQAIYVSGIGGRIDAGAWKALEPEKRLEGFRHVFLWLREGHVILGRMHSSEDGLHRKEYPLVLCADTEGIAPERILTWALPELDRLLNACQATSSTEQVTAECRMAQERLHDVFLRNTASGVPAISLPSALRQRFVEHRNLGPNRQGLLRALHELGISEKSQADSRPRHLRLPLAADSRDQSLLLWAGFLHPALPAGSPLLLISRDGTDWIDVVVGEPSSDDLFCLQATPKAQPLASEIPYDLAPELRQRLQQLEARFLGVEAGASAKPQTASAAKPVVLPPVPPPPSTSPGRRSSKGLFVLIGLVVVLGAAAGLWLVSGNRGSPPESKPLSSANPPPAAPPSERAPPLGTQPSEPSNSNATTVEAARLAAEQEAKAQAEAEARRQADAKKTADEKAKAAPSTAASTQRAKAGDEDVDLSKLAVARGNYARAQEIIRKWPGDERFKAILAQVSAETNLLLQLTNALLAGKYQAILSSTNPLPDNPRFKELLAQAEAESKLLEQAQAEFTKGDYAFLEKPELQEFKTRPPFQKLLQSGAAEAELLRKAQALKAQNQPQTAHDLIVQNTLTKPQFADIEQWAKVELDKAVGQVRDRQQAETLFQQGDYTQALVLCKKYPGVATFDAVARGVSEEQAILKSMEAKLAAGDYSFLGNLGGQPYRSKPPFAELQRRGTAEQGTLTELEKLKQANDWQAVQTGLAKLPTDTARKKPFAELAQWAQSQASQDEAVKNKDPGWLDAELEVLLVQFNVLGPNDRWLQTPKARKEKPIEGMLAINVKEYYLNRVRLLRAEYTKRDWLNQRDRKKYLDRLESNIEIR